MGGMAPRSSRGTAAGVAGSAIAFASSLLLLLLVLMMTACPRISAQATSCPPQPGFTVQVDKTTQVERPLSLSLVLKSFYTFKDYPATACLGFVECKGFVLVTRNVRNTSYFYNVNGGWLKSTTTTPISATGLCLYTKTTATYCPAKEGYTVTADKTVVGWDVSPGTPGSTWTGAAVDNACSMEPKCKGFTLVTSYTTDSSYFSQVDKIWLKTSVAANTQTVKGICLYTKQPGTYCPYITGYTAQIDTEQVGADLSRSPLFQPERACNARADCAGFVLGTSLCTGSSYLGYIGPVALYGLLKSSTTDTRRATCFCLYTKLPLVNVALGAPAYASSEYTPRHAARYAVDGIAKAPSTYNTDMFHTALNDTARWLSIDLGGFVSVTRVVIYHRDDICIECGRRLVAAEVRIGNASITSPETAFKMGQNVLVWNLPGGAGVVGAVYNITPSAPVVGRWVTLQNLHPASGADGVLNIRELEVYGVRIKPTSE